MDKNQKKENSKKKNSLGRIFFFIITIILIASCLDPDLYDWLWYNLYYRPLYFFFSDFLYSTFFYRCINIILITCFILFFSIPEVFRYEKKKRKEKEGSQKEFYTYMQYFGLIVVIVTFVLSLYFLYPFALDIRYIVKKEYLIETSDITRYKRYTYTYRGYRGRKGISSEYRLYTYTPVKKNDGYYFNLDTYTPIEEKRKGLSSYEFLELNAYQYIDLKNYQSNLSMKDTVTNKKIKVYYLPNSRVILKYEFIN